MSMYSNVSALSSLSVDMLAIANNVANVNTDAYHARDVRLESGPDGQGVAVGQIAEDTSAGPALPLTPQPAPPSAAPVTAFVEGSNVDLAREFTQLVAVENAYAANAEAIRAQDEMVGALIDELV